MADVVTQDRRDSPWLRHAFDRLPDSVKTDIFHLLFSAMAWRGWAGTNSIHGKNSGALVQQIADIFEMHGYTIEEYT